MEKYNLIFIDDNMKELELDPFVRTIADLNPDADVKVFLDSKQGLEYIERNINSKMVVFLDCKFEVCPLQGIDVLKSIRKQTSLLYVVMMSANNLSEMDQSSIIEMINEDYICFFNRNTKAPKDTTEILDHIIKLWDVRFDCVLEDWIIRHPEDSDKIVFSEADKEYTWADILNEVRLQTSIGKSFEKMVHEFYIYRFPRNING